MTTTGTITTFYVDSTGVDLGKQFVEEDYLISVYPNLIPNFKSAGLFSCGENTYGQLGNSSTSITNSLGETTAKGTNWKNVSAGRSFALGIKTDGTLWTWGRNQFGQLGNTSTIDRSSPIQVTGTTWMKSAAGETHSAAVKTDGTLWTWGYNTTGQLGDETTTHRSSPVQTKAAGTNWLDVACGLYHVVAIKTDGTLWGWGRNLNGELGDDTRTNKSSPVQTKALGTNWKQVSCGSDHTMAIKYDGTLWGWGSNTNGRLGDNTTTSKSSPVQVVGSSTNWKQVSCGQTHTAAVKTDGTLWCWGDNNVGQLGDNSTTHRSSPVQTVTSGTNWNSVSGGYRMTSAIKTDGTLWVWGVGANGSLGTNDFTHRSSPLQTASYGNTWRGLMKGPTTRSNYAIRDFEF